MTRSATSPQTEFRADPDAGQTQARDTRLKLAQPPWPRRAHRDLQPFGHAPRPIPPPFDNRRQVNIIRGRARVLATERGLDTFRLLSARWSRPLRAPISATGTRRLIRLRGSARPAERAAHRPHLGGVGQRSGSCGQDVATTRPRRRWNKVQTAMVEPTFELDRITQVAAGRGRRGVLAGAAITRAVKLRDRCRRSRSRSDRMDPPGPSASWRTGAGRQPYAKRFRAESCSAFWSPTGLFVIAGDWSQGRGAMAPDRLSVRGGARAGR